MVGTLERVLTWVFDRSAPGTFLVLVFVGVALVIASLLIGVGFFALPLGTNGSKQVGYVLALNWSIMFVLGFPVMMFFMLEAVDSAKQTLRRLVDHRMIVDRSWHPVAIEALDGERARVRRRSAIAGGLMVVLMTGYCVGEWFAVSGIYLISGDIPLQPGEVHWFDELDWSVAAVLPGPRQGDFGFRMWNAAFGFANYFLLGLYLAAILTFYAMLIMYSEMFIRLSRGEAVDGLKIVPDVNESDPRRGFGNFERMFRRVLFATMAGFLLCYFMNVQNLFLRSEAAHIGAFISGDIARGFSIFLGGDVKEGLAKIAHELFAARYIFNISSVWAAILVFCIFSLVSLSLAWVLSEAAQRGRDDLRLYVRREENPIGQLTNLDREDCLARLGSWSGDGDTGMMIWPFGWPSLRQLSLFLLFGAICIVLYRFGLVFAGIGVGWVILNVLGVFRPSK